MTRTKVTIIVPVYGAWPSLKDCLKSLKEHTTSAQCNVMIINDGGPEADTIEANIKQSIKGLSNYNYFRNESNLGFVGTCNRAVLELDKTSNDILLLNSDTKVTPGFLDELTAVLEADAKIGAVSPRSNNATIATIPLASAPQKGIKPETSYKLFQTIKDKLPRYKTVPTAHGFCMLIRRKLIKRYGLFDPIFGRGYGEEVDFCQRIAKHGYKSVLANHVFVFHLEARSFSPADKAILLEQNNQILRKRYPDYQQTVRDYIKKANQDEDFDQNRLRRLLTKTRKKLSIKVLKK